MCLLPGLASQTFYLTTTQGKGLVTGVCHSVSSSRIWRSILSMCGGQLLHVNFECQTQPLRSVRNCIFYSCRTWENHGCDLLRNIQTLKLLFLELLTLSGCILKSEQEQCLKKNLQLIKMSASLTIGFVKSLCYILLHWVETSVHKNSIRNDLRTRLEAALITFLIITANLSQIPVK